MSSNPIDSYLLLAQGLSILFVKISIFSLLLALDSFCRYWKHRRDLFPFFLKFCFQRLLLSALERLLTGFYCAFFIWRMLLKKKYTFLANFWRKLPINLAEFKIFCWQHNNRVTRLRAQLPVPAYCSHPPWTHPFSPRSPAESLRHSSPLVVIVPPLKCDLLFSSIHLDHHQVYIQK